MKNKTLVPKLRFPEFVENWSIKSLGALGRFIGGGTPDRSEIEYWKGDIAWISSSDLIDDNLTEIKIRNYINQGSIKNSATKIVPKGSVLFVSRVGTGKLAINPIELCTSQDFTSLVPINVHNYYVGYYFLAKKSILSSFNQGTSIKGFSKSDLEKIIILLPSLTEQKKIADCLSSLDDLITAQTQKLETLKTYKKGLMQQLFPAEGEIVPKLRFEGFEGDWEEKKLKDISSSIFDGTHQTPTYTKVGVPFYSVENLVSGNKNKFISNEDYLTATKKNKPEKGDILLTRIGKIGFSTVVSWDHDFSVYVTLAVIKKSGLFDSYYLHYFMQSSRYQTELLSKSLLNAVPCKINMDSLRDTFILLPTNEEQQKIADCLSSIDDLITAQTQTIENLKLHKKGLMQQLFPSNDEVGDE